MKAYKLKRIQSLPIGIQEAWDFFSTPENLKRITPEKMNFEIMHRTGDELFEGQVIRYKIKIPPGVRVRWVSEITHVNKPHHFVDEQLSGPYALWHHEHHFKEIEEGVEVTDEVTYAIPLGWIGRLANVIFVKRELNAIFDYRHSMLRKLLSKTDAITIITASLWIVC
jgi:ligand-binding SRPBCC domain-containing protein